MQQLLNKLPSPVLITGSAFSGKSRIAQQVMGPLDAVTVIGTCVAESALLRLRINELQALRPGGWRTLETAGDIAPVLEKLAGDDQHLLLDSFSLWMSSRVVVLASQLSQLTAEEDQIYHQINADIDELLKVMERFKQQRLVIVTADIGAGVSPERPAERLLRMLLGTANCRLAAFAKSVVQVTCGIPVVIKNT